MYLPQCRITANHHHSFIPPRFSGDFPKPNIWDAKCRQLSRGSCVRSCTLYKISSFTTRSLGMTNMAPALRILRLEFERWIFAKSIFCLVLYSCPHCRKVHPALPTLSERVSLNCHCELHSKHSVCEGETGWGGWWWNSCIVYHEISFAKLW